MRQYVFWVLLLCIATPEQAEASMCRRARNYFAPAASRVAATFLGTTAETLHILIPQIISAGVSLEEVINHEAPHPLLASSMALVAATLPGMIAQGVLQQQTDGRVLGFRDLGRSAALGLCSGIIIRKGAHLFLIVFPNSWVSGLGFICLSLAVAPTLTSGAYRFASSTMPRLARCGYDYTSQAARNIWHWCQRLHGRATDDAELAPADKTA